MAKSKGLDIIDNNPLLAPGGNLKDEFAKSDGLHYLPKTYLVWKAAVEKVLLKNGL